MAKWTANDLPDQTGRTVIVTGATSGLGEVTAGVLAGAGARTVLAVRNVEKGKQLAAKIGGPGRGPVEVRRLDLADLSSVRAFAEGWQDPIDILVNNAGVMAVPLSRSTDGFELQLATNHLGHFALTNLLLDKITDRVVSVSSGAHRMGGLDVTDLNWQRRDYRPWQAYGQTKLANLLFILELQHRLQADGSRIRALAAHPGYSATNLQSGLGHPVKDALMSLANKLVAQSAEMGALPTLFAASQELPGASYVGPDGRGEMKGYPTLVGRTSDAADLQLAAKLWEESEKLTGVSYPG